MLIFKYENGRVPKKGAGGRTVLNQPRARQITELLTDYNTQWFDQVWRWLTSVGEKILMQFVFLILQHIAQVSRHLASYAATIEGKPTRTEVRGATYVSRRGLAANRGRQSYIILDHSHWSNSRVSRTINMGPPFSSRMVSATWPVEV